MMTLVWMCLAGLAFAGPAEEPYGDHLARAILAQEAELLAAVSRDDPGHYQRLLRLKEVDQAAYVAGLYKVATLLDRMARDPLVADRWRAILQRQAELRALAAGYEGLRPAQQAQRRQEMSAKAASLLDLRQEDRRARLQELSSRLEQLRRELAVREAEKDLMIEKTIDEALREARGQ
jgi:ABC-type phosphate transport system auxiliary subunit